jgi:serine/threonine protein kinase
MHELRRTSSGTEYIPTESDNVRTPRVRRKSDIHALLPEMLSRHDSEAPSFHLIGGDESLSDFYRVDAAFYSVGGKSVTRCTEVSTGNGYVMKRRAKDAYGAEVERHWRRMMERLLHLPPNPHIVKIIEVLEDEVAFYIVMEDCDGGQLFDLLLRESSMTQKECKRILRQLLIAVGHLNNNGLIHRDIKPENVVLRTENGESTIKLIDFDTCEEIISRRLSVTAVTPKKRSSRVVGTLGYIAPECFDGEYSTASDLFSVGIIFYILMTGDMPFDDSIYRASPGEGDEELGVAGSPRSRKVRSKIIHSSIDWDVSPWNQLPLARDLCLKLLSIDPEERISSCEDALKHPWLAGATYISNSS